MCDVQYVTLFAKNVADGSFSSDSCIITDVQLCSLFHTTDDVFVEYIIYLNLYLYIFHLIGPHQRFWCASERPVQSHIPGRVCDNSRQGSFKADPKDHL